MSSHLDPPAMDWTTRNVTVNPGETVVVDFPDGL